MSTEFIVISTLCIIFQILQTVQMCVILMPSAHMWMTDLSVSVKLDTLEMGTPALVSSNTSAY